MEENKIEQWFLESITVLQNDSYSCSIHVDECCDYRPSCSLETLEKSILVWNYFCSAWKRLLQPNLQLFMQIVLHENDGVLKGVFKTEEELMDIIDRTEVPEIFLYRQFNPLSIPNSEFYRIPISLRKELVHPRTLIFYKEFRDLNCTIMTENHFTRELNFVFL
jgi:hypothetical protein